MDGRNWNVDVRLIHLGLALVDQGLHMVAVVFLGIEGRAWYRANVSVKLNNLRSAKTHNSFLIAEQQCLEIPIFLCLCPLAPESASTDADSGGFGGNKQRTQCPETWLLPGWSQAKPKKKSPAAETAAQSREEQWEGKNSFTYGAAVVAVAAVV